MTVKGSKPCSRKRARWERQNRVTFSLRYGFVHHGRVKDNDGAAIGWIREIVLDSTDAWELASFWAGLLGGTPVEWYPGWVTLEPPPHGQR